VAGAGYKAFADGDVLTAAQVQTYLQDQAVMRFADSSARTTGLGTAVAEGMVSYLQDTDAVEVYDGSAWVGLSGGFTASTAITATDASWSVPTLADPGVKVTVVVPMWLSAVAVTRAVSARVADVSVVVTTPSLVVPT